MFGNFFISQPGGGGGSGNGDMLAENNLDDLDDVSVARTNLDVYSTGEVDTLIAGTLLVTNNLGDLDDVAEARDNLDVYSTAEVDALVTGIGPPTVNKVNDNAGTLPPGHAVYAKANGHVDSAQANAAGTTECLGLAAAQIVTTATGPIQTAGTLTLTTGQWDVITGQSGGLTPGAYYYVSPTASGSLTVTAPTTAGQYVSPVGLAHSATEMEIRPERAILL